MSAASEYGCRLAVPIFLMPGIRVTLKIHPGRHPVRPRRPLHPIKEVNPPFGLLIQLRLSLIFPMLR